MDFIFVKSLNDYSLKIDNLKYDETKYWSSNCFVMYNNGTQVHFTESGGIALSGRVRKDNLGNVESVQSLFEDANSNKWPLTDNFTGAFSGFSFGENGLSLFNDPIGIYKLYYHIDNDIIIISTSLTDLTEVKKFEFNYSAWFLEMTPPEYSQYGTSTIF